MSSMNSRPVLHLVSASPTASPALIACLTRMTAGSVLLLLEDGVYAALAGGPQAETLRQTIAGGIRLVALLPDLQARGLAGRALLPEIELTGYEGFVALAAECPTSQSWF